MRTLVLPGSTSTGIRKPLASAMVAGEGVSPKTSAAAWVREAWRTASIPVVAGALFLGRAATRMISPGRGSLVAGGYSG